MVSSGRMWVEATPAVSFQRGFVDLTLDVYQQIHLDMARTFGPMLFQHDWDEVMLNSRRGKVESLLIKWLQNQEEFTYMQGMNHMMAVCYRQVEDDDGALQVFDHMIRQVNASVFHQDPLKLFESIHEISEQLRSKVSESCKDVASKLTEADVDFFPMIAQNWFIDIFLHILPIDAAVRLWDRIILDKMPEVPVKFALNLLLLSKNDILICSPEDLNDVVADLPKRIRTPADVDWLLDSSDSSKVDAVTVNLIEKVETCEVTPFVVPLKFSKRRWQPWKFLTVAMVIPWLLMHVTQVHPRAGRTARPARPMVVHHLASPVALNEAWPTWPM